MEGMSRRSLVKRMAAVFAASKLPSFVRNTEAEISRPVFEFQPLLTKESIREHRSDAIDELLNQFWHDENIREFALEHYFDISEREQASLSEEALWNKAHSMFLRESAMYVPRPDVCESVFRENREKISRLAREIPEGKHGLFVSGGRQRLYVLKKVEGKIYFVKGYKCSTSREEWSHVEGSHGTPPDMHWIVEEKAKVLGEAVSSGKYADDFETVRDDNGRPRTMVRSLKHGTDRIAEMVTRRFLLWGQNTPRSRAINLHGTNRTDLLGEEGSGGCIRLSNIDIQDIAQYIEVGVPGTNSKRSESQGTPIMLHYGPVHYR